MSDRGVLHSREHPAGGLQGDFTTTPRVIVLSLLALAIGMLSTLVAFALLRFISLFTNLFYFQRWSTELVSPAQNTLGGYAVAGRQCDDRRRGAGLHTRSVHPARDARSCSRPG